MEKCNKTKKQKPCLH